MGQYAPVQDAKLSIAPMMDWTDRYCRYFHRQFSYHTVLYTEMITAAAIVHGDAARLLRFDPVEHPVVLQLGGSEPSALAEAACIAADMGYDEINLNCGCPSDRVQSGAFGAVLMESPELVADCVSAMKKAAPGVETSIKCRIGIDDQDPNAVLPNFLRIVRDGGAQRFTIHARKAWLKGLSPKENRDIPPLDYDLVHQMKAEFPDLWIGINGGITTLEAAQDLLSRNIDGVMIGREAYHNPTAILGPSDLQIYGTGQTITAHGAIAAMLPYIEDELSAGTRLNQITRHMIGAFQGRPGARRWRQMLSEGAHKPGAGPDLVEAAMAQVEDGRLDAAS